MRRALCVLTLAVSLSCGGNGLPPSSQFANKCQTPRTGIDPITHNAYPDKPGSLNDEKSWLRSWADELYLWYKEIPSVDASKYTTALDYFNALKTPAKTASGKAKDQFHFTYDTAVWEALTTSGTSAGYGVTWALVSRSPPRIVFAAYVDPGSPAATAGITRGTQVLTVDGTDVSAGDPNALNAGLFPNNASETHSFSVVDRGSTSPHTISMTSASVVSVPVQHVGLIPGTTVGYMLFTEFIGPAEKALVDGVTKLKSLGATDLVLDLRYNGGGYLVIAAQLAYMIANPSRTANKTFEQTVFNDKYPTTDPVTGSALSPTPFVSQGVGLSVTSGTALPHLDLDRVFVLVGSGTCSASEAVLNGLSGVDEQVYLVGKTTCGKPYGFYAQDNCGTTYFQIEFKGVNNKGFGDYADGFVPSAGLPGGPAGCQVADDFGHELGDPNEARLAAALGLRSGAACPAATSRSSLTAESRYLADEVYLVRNPAQENRIMWRPR